VGQEGKKKDTNRFCMQGDREKRGMKRVGEVLAFEIGGEGQGRMLVNTDVRRLGGGG